MKSEEKTGEGKRERELIRRSKEIKERDLERRQRNDQNRPR
jgi:hypothetical protein